MSNAQILLKGDAVAGAPFIAFAKAKLAALRGLGLDHAQRTFVVGDVEIQINIRPEGDRIYIQAGGSCPLIAYNGYLDAYPSLSAYTGEQPVRLRELQENEENLPRTRNGEFVAGDPKMYGMRKVPAYDLVNDPEPVLPPGYAMLDEVYPLVSVPRQTPRYALVSGEPDMSGDLFRQVFYGHPPTKYTGIMRQLLQATYGTEAWSNGLMYKDTAEGNKLAFNFNYRFGDTWGVVLEPGTDGSEGKHYHLVWVHHGEVRSVPASVCVHKKKLDGVDVYAPVCRSVDRSKFKVVGTFAYDGFPCSYECGWAFSYMEPKASAIIYSFGGDGHYYTQLITINFTFGNGVLTGASAEMIGTKKLFWFSERGDKAAANPISILSVPSDDGKKNITFDVYNFPTPYIPDYRANRVPVYVYYIPGESRPQLVEYQYEKRAASSETIPAPATAEEAFSGWYGSKSEGVSIRWGFALNGENIPAVNGAYSSNYTSHTLGGVNSDMPGFYEYSNPRTFYFPISYTRPTPPYSGDTTGAVTFHRTPAMRQVLYENTVISGGAVTLGAACLVPIDDRECVVLMVSRSTSPVSEIVYRSNQFTFHYESGGGIDLQGVGTYTTASGVIDSYPFVPVGSMPSGSAAIKAAVRIFEESTGWSAVSVGNGSCSDVLGPFDGHYSWPFVGGYNYPTWNSASYGLFQLWSSVTRYPSTLPAIDKSHNGLLETSVKLYGWHEPVSLDYSKWGGWLVSVLDDTSPLSVHHMTAAFSKKYFQYDKIPTKKVVRMQEEVYDIKNDLSFSLHGWMGVV